MPSLRTSSIRSAAFTTSSSGRFRPAVAVPRVELTGRPTSEFPFRFAGHRYLRGVPADAVDPALLPAVARAVGAALGALHAVAESAARAAGVRELDAEDNGRARWLQHGLEVTSTLRGVDPVVDQAIEWIGQPSLSFPRFDGPLRLIHHDLSPEQLLVDPVSGTSSGSSTGPT